MPRKAAVSPWTAIVTLQDFDQSNLGIDSQHLKLASKACSAILIEALTVDGASHGY